MTSPRLARCGLFGVVLLGCVLELGCDDTVATVSPEPIAVGPTDSSTAAALYALATVDGVATPFPVLIDTGTPLTTYDDHSGLVAARTGQLHLFSVSPIVPRLELAPVRLFSQTIAPVGAGAGFQLGGVFGGDNLSRFAATLDFRPPAALTLLPQLTPCSCELASDCLAVFPFPANVGGTQDPPNDRRIQIGSNLYTYPGTRVLIDMCLEPLADPISQSCPCADGIAERGPACPAVPDGGLAPEYLPTGIDVKVLVASGFPGFGLSSGALDRLRGPGTALAVLAQTPVQIHLPDLADNGGPNGAGLTVGQTLVGGGAHEALALVSREVYNGSFSLGPCAELARSRRLRRFNPRQPDSTKARDGNPEKACEIFGGDPTVQSCAGGDACEDSNSNAAAVIELAAAVPAYVVPDLSPLLIGINADVRPQNPTVEGLIGTEVLSRLVTTIDYPNQRVVARCARDDAPDMGAPTCLTYPRYVHTQDNCDHKELECKTPDAIADSTDPSGSPRLGGACPPAPAR
jgi:hypothetical protein